MEPATLPAAVAIDWTLPGKRIGDWQAHRRRPYAAATLARIRAGLDRYAVPVLAPAGGTRRRDAAPVTAPMATRTCTENDGIAVPPLLVAVEARAERDRVTTSREPLRAQTTRNQTGVAWLPFLTPLRGGGDRDNARPVTEPLATVTASGNHHGLACPPELAGMVMRNDDSRGDGAEHCMPVSQPPRTLTTAGHQSLITWDHLLVPYYGTGQARPAGEPVGALTTRDRYGPAATRGAYVPIEDVWFRMLEPHEIGRAMSFGPDYVVLGNKRERVRQYGNAVTPNVAERLISALVEAVTGDQLDPGA